MHLILILMIVIFLAAGSWLIRIAIQEMFQKRTLISSLVKTQGTVTEIYTETRLRLTTEDRKRKRTIHERVHFPIIQFQSSSGEVMTFKSELGDVTRLSRPDVPSKYYVDQILPIVYDPQGRVTPMVDSWWGIWSAHVFSLAGGVLLIFGSGLIWLVFGQKILAAF